MFRLSKIIVSLKFPCVLLMLSLPTIHVSFFVCPILLFVNLFLHQMGAPSQGIFFRYIRIVRIGSPGEPYVFVLHLNCTYLLSYLRVLVLYCCSIRVGKRGYSTCMDGRRTRLMCRPLQFTYHLGIGTSVALPSNLQSFEKKVCIETNFEINVSFLMTLQGSQESAPSNSTLFSATKF